jgi:hypothetical protein
LQMGMQFSALQQIVVEDLHRCGLQSFADGHTAHAVRLAWFLHPPFTPATSLCLRRLSPSPPRHRPTPCGATHPFDVVGHHHHASARCRRPASSSRHG